MPTIQTLKRLAVVCAAAVLSGALSAAAAEAGGLYQEHVYADSFGNLVVYSPAGYKRIVVGRGYLAHRMRAGAESSNARQGPRVVYLDRGGEAAPACRHHAVLLHGRSYMYGLPDNVVPEPSAGCW